MAAQPPTTPPVSRTTDGAQLFRNIMFGGVAGVIGQSCVYPLYVVKTRMHTQPDRYRHAVHCFRKIVQHEGWRGLYRGMPPAVIGVFPEKALKLSINDYLRSRLQSSDGTLSSWRAMLAGGGAGLCQVIATNPMEMTMITMQTRSAQGRKPKSLMHVVRSLGLPGLYRGTAATLLRDIPFSMVLFPLRTTMENAFADKRTGETGITGVFFAGIIAGSTAAAVSTPMDVIKTRLMAEAGSAAHDSAVRIQPVGTKSIARTQASQTMAKPQLTIASCAQEIWAKEGILGFFNGVGPRLFTISPLFGITLMFYELQKRFEASQR